MNKPNAPQKPRKYDAEPQSVITVVKFLVFDKTNKKYLLIDQQSHPECYRDPENPENTTLSDEPYWAQLEDFNYEWEMEHRTFYQHKLIAENCNLPGDFTILPENNSDGYYEHSYVEYKIEDPDYHKKLKEYKNRFVNYEKGEVVVFQFPFLNEASELTELCSFYDVHGPTKSLSLLIFWSPCLTL